LTSRHRCKGGVNINNRENTRVFENRVLRRIFALKEEVTGG